MTDRHPAAPPAHAPTLGGGAALLRRLVCGLAAALVLVAAPAHAAPPPAGKGDPQAGKAVEARTVRFVNNGPGVTLRVDGGAWIPLSRGQATSVEVRASSVRYVVARGTHWQYEAVVDLRNVVKRTVELVPPGGYLRVVNRSGEPRMVVWAGSALGMLKRGEARLYGPLRTGTHALLATGARSRDTYAQRLALHHGGRSTAVLAPVPAGLVVPNPLDEPAHLVVDHGDYGDIAPGARVTVLGLPPGEHKIELIGRRSGKPWRYDASLGTRGTSPPKPGALTLKIHNETGEPLQLAAALEGLHDGPIPAGAKVTLQVARKRFRLAATGKRSGLPYHLDVHPDRGGVQTWAPVRPQGQLHLTNATGEAASLDVDGLATIELRAGQRLTVRKVPAGALQLRVTTKTSGTTFEKGIVLPPNGDVGWKVSAGRTSLIIDNRYREQVSIVVDGAPRGDVAPGAIFKLEGIPAGPHTIVARTRWSKRTELAEVRVVDGTKTRFVLAPPLATVRVVNPMAEPLDVVIRGRGVGHVKPGKTRAFATESGRLVVVVHAVKSGRSASWSGTLAPGQHLPVPTPKRAGELVEVHNPLAEPLNVQVDRRAPVSVAAKGSLRLSDLAPGPHLIRLIGPGFEQRQRVEVKAGRPIIQIAPLAD